MGQLPLALSVHKFINSVGADAGFAAIIGLAILILLYFAQARETNTLRQRAQELLERVGELEARIARLSAARQQPAAVAQPVAARPLVAPAPPVAVAAGAAASAGARLTALELPPYPPAGVAAPALSAATRVVPAGIPVRAAAARVPVPVGAGPPAEALSPETVASAAPAPPETEAPAPAPATAAGTSNGSSHGRVAPQPAGLRPGGGSGQPPRGPAPRPAAAAAAAGARRSRARTADEYQFSGPPSQSRVGRVVLIGLAILAVAAIAVVVVLVATHSSSSKNPAASSQTAHHTSRSSATTVNPAAVTVSVLNGTSTSGAAHVTWTKLQRSGFRQGLVTNATDQTHTATVVAYIPGARNQALAVAQALKLGQASVQPLDQNTRAVVCQGQASCSTSVVVTVGSDLAGK